MLLKKILVEGTEQQEAQPAEPSVEQELSVADTKDSHHLDTEESAVSVEQPSPKPTRQKNQNQ